LGLAVVLAMILIDQDMDAYKNCVKNNLDKIVSSSEDRIENRMY